MLITNTQADDLLSALSHLSGLDEELTETCSGLIRAQRYDEAVSRAFVVLEERLRKTLGVRGGAGVHLSEKAFAPDSGDLVERLMRPRGEVDGIRNLFVGAFKAYRNRAAHTMAHYTRDEARAIIHLVNLLLLILEQVAEAPSHPVRQDVANLLEPGAVGRLRLFLQSLEDIGIRAGGGKSATPYQAIMAYHPPTREAPSPYEVTVFYLNASGVLICAAHNRQTMTYPMLGELVGLPPWALGNPLDHIQVHCQENDLPPLTGLVVRTGEGQPGPGFDSPEDMDRARENVFDHNWFRMRPITPEGLEHRT
jgi:uncharacterized protein (TIGR02391 family)